MTELVQRDINWARKITERLRLQATNYQEAREKVMTTLHEARDGGAAELLGYASFTAYMADVFGDSPLRLERDQRQELVAELAAQGMSTRTIAPIFATTKSSIDRDLQVSRRGTPEPPDGYTPSQVWDYGTHHPLSGTPVTDPSNPPHTMMQANPETGEVEDVPARHVTGMDGKQYAVPVRTEPRRENRRAITDAANSAAWDVRRAVEKLERVRADDRLTRNRDEILRLVAANLTHTIEACQGFLDALREEES